MRRSHPWYHLLHSQDDRWGGSLLYAGGNNYSGSWRHRTYQSNALLIANTCFTAVPNIGIPEGRRYWWHRRQYKLEVAVTKSNYLYMAIEKLLVEFWKSRWNVPIPLHLRNAPTQLMKELGYGKDYQYAHGIFRAILLIWTICRKNPETSHSILPEIIRQKKKKKFKMSCRDLKGTQYLNIVK